MSYEESWRNCVIKKREEKVGNMSGVIKHVGAYTYVHRG